MGYEYNEYYNGFFEDVVETGKSKGSTTLEAFSIFFTYESAFSNALLWETLAAYSRSVRFRVPHNEYNNLYVRENTRNVSNVARPLTMWEKNIQEVVFFSVMHSKKEIGVDPENK